MPQKSLITTQAQLESLIDTLAKSDFLAVDTEFHREKTYFPELCLIQIASNDVSAAIDPLLDLDLSLLLELLSDEKRTKVFHAARQDLEIFYQLTGSVLSPVFDTQIAAMALGFGDQISYVNLVERVLGTRLSKAQQLTNWLRRPLSDQQLRYALDDVVYLRAVYSEIVQRLEAQDRLSWLKEEESRLINPAAFESNPEGLIKGIRLKDRSAKAYTTLLHLATWRDQAARAANCPRHHIIKDDGLTMLAQQRPTSPEQTNDMRMVSKDFIKKYGDDIFKIITDVNNTADDELKKPTKVQRSNDETNSLVLKMAQLLIAYKAESEQITPRLIANSADIQNFVIGKPSALESGWRYELVGKDIEQLIKGELALAIKEGKLVSFTP